ncbi:MAG TPA: polysaccharide deacetylase family protein [Candidatus Binatia bacterium]|nr:polysaccharide deacetylase family protein [Candidatus Binatia bacterium]
MNEPRPRRRREDRSILESPLLAAALALVVLALAGALLLPGLLGGPGTGPTATPGSSGAAPTPTPTPPGPTFVRPTPSPAPTFVSYVVQSGDSLNSIARKFGTTARSIAWWNRGAYPTLDPESEEYDPNHLEVGWVLSVLPNSIVDENNPPTPSPGPATPPPSTPGPTTAPTPTSPPAAGPAAVVSHGKRTLPTIALTFDMGGRLDPAIDIVEWLIDHEVHATLFPTGKSGSQTAQGLAALQLAATRPDLFDFANHSWDHPDFRDLTRAQMTQQLSSTEAALAPVIGSTKPWFRPPFGGWNAEVQAGVGAAGWRYLVMWDVDTIDWRPEADGGPTAAGIEAKVRNSARGGSIVLMHLGGWNTLEALPGILDACNDLGLEPVTLTEMLGA